MILRNGQEDLLGTQGKIGHTSARKGVDMYGSHWRDGDLRSVRTIQNRARID